MFAMVDLVMQLVANDVPVVPGMTWRDHVRAAFAQLASEELIEFLLMLPMTMPC